MPTEQQKAATELSVFDRFCTKAQLSVVPGSARKCPPSEPDIFCEIQGEGPVRFELTESCAHEFAKATNVAPESDVTAMWLTDVTEQTVQSKLEKKWEVEEPIELVVYNDGRSLLTDYALVDTVRYVVRNFGNGPFRRVWVLAENVHEV